MWNHIREKKSSNEFPSYYVGEYLFASFYNFPHYIWCSMRKLSYFHITSKMDILIMYSLFYFCSDWNGSKRGHVYKFLRSQGFVSSYDDAHKYTDSDADAHKVCCLQVTILFYYFSALVFTWPLISQTNKANQLLYFLCLFLFDVLQWVSHRNHRGNICGVDFIWLCNPNKSRKPLRTSWAEAVFSIIKVSNIYYLVKYSYILTSH